MVAERVGKGGVDEVTHEESLVSHFYNELFPALVVGGPACSGIWVAVVGGDEVREEEGVLLEGEGGLWR